MNVPSSRASQSLRLVGSFVLDPVRETLEYLTDGLELPLTLEIDSGTGGAGVLRQLVDPDSLFRRSGAAIQALVLRLDDWAADLEGLVQELEGLLLGSASWASRLLVVFCPASAQASTSLVAR